ncbi:MAG: ABC-type spermidine/putrescine transport system, ATPase component, partial [Firmicutes bacterium]|nr:ABC-type spermidine/putrescine transport system, ATPase component [Bacillota bacterium]
KNENHRLGILGASGSGKSLTLKCIAGIEKPDSGQIVLNGRVLFDSEKKINIQPQQRRVGYLFQNYALFPTMTVEENIGIAIKASKEERHQIVAAKIKEYRLEGLKSRYPSELSGGQQQRVALARMLVSSPDIIMLDEPFSSLDSYLKDLLQEQLLETLTDYQGDVLLVTHNREEVYRFCERLLIINKGRSIILGDTRELFERPIKMEAARLIGCKNLSPIRRIDSHTIEAVEWGIQLTLRQTISENTKYVGIHAHDLLPFWEQPISNYIPFTLVGSGDLPSEEHFFIKSMNHTSEESLRWYVQKDRMGELNDQGLPSYLYFPEEKLLLLE